MKSFSLPSRKTNPNSPQPLKPITEIELPSFPSTMLIKKTDPYLNNYSSNNLSDNSLQLSSSNNANSDLLSSEQFLYQCFQKLEISHLVIERNLFYRNPLLLNNNQSLPPSPTTTSDLSSAEFHIRYFKDIDLFTNWSQGSNLNPITISNSTVQTEQLLLEGNNGINRGRGQYKSSLFQMIKSRLLLHHSKRAEFINEVNMVKEVLALCWTRCGEDESIANRSISFHSFPYVKQVEIYQSRAPSFMKDILRYVSIQFEPIENLLCCEEPISEESSDARKKRTKILDLFLNYDVDKNEISDCLKRIFENKKESFVQFKDMLSNLDQYLSNTRYSNQEEETSDCLIQNYIELLSSEIPMDEKASFITFQVNQLYMDLFLYFQTICNEYLVSYLHQIRGFDHHEHEFKQIPQDLIIEKPFTIIELCSNQLRSKSIVNQNLKEKFSQFKARKKNRSLEVSFRDLNSHFTKFGYGFSETFENLLSSFQMHEMVHHVKKESDHYKTMDSNSFSVFSKPPTAYVFCLEIKGEDNSTTTFHQLNSIQPEIFEFKELILQKLDKDRACEIPAEYLRHVSFDEMITKLLDSPVKEKLSDDEKKSNHPIVNNDKSNLTIQGESPTPKRKMFTIKKDPSRELKEIDLLEKEVEQLEQQANEHKELFERFQHFKQEQPTHHDRKEIFLKIQEQTPRSRLETIITTGYSCLALCSIYKCESYRRKLSTKLEELSKSLLKTKVRQLTFDEYNNEILVSELESIIFEHSYYLGYQIPSLLTRNYTGINCSKFKGYQRLYKYLEIINSFPSYQIVDISPLNVAEMLKLSTRKLQSDLEILTQVRHFKSISLYNSHETSCGILSTIVRLCKYSKFQSMISLIMKEFNTLQVASELLRLMLKHFDAFKDYIACLLELFKEMTITMKVEINKEYLNENNSITNINEDIIREMIEKESDLLKTSFCSTSFAFSLILCLSGSLSKLHWNQCTVYDLNCFVSSLKNLTSGGDEEMLCSGIAMNSTFILTQLLENDSLTCCLNNCNRLEKLLPLTVMKCIRNYQNLDLGRQVLQLLAVSSKKIAYSSSSNNGTAQFTTGNHPEQLVQSKDISIDLKKVLETSIIDKSNNEFLDKVEDEWKFSYRDLFMDNDAPPILLMILNKFVLNYLDDNVGMLQEEKLELDHLKNEACKILSIISEGLVSLLESQTEEIIEKSDEASLESLIASPVVAVDGFDAESNRNETEDQQVRREIYTCLFYILLECIFLERSEQNLIQHQADLDLFSIAWKELVRLTRNYPDFRLCVERQFVLNVYLKELTFLKLLILESRDLLVLESSGHQLSLKSRNSFIQSESATNDKITTEEERRLDKELFKYDSNLLKNLNVFLEDYRVMNLNEQLRKQIEEEELNWGEAGIVISQFELALYSLKKQRLHTKRSQQLNECYPTTTSNSALSMVEISCLKYTNEFFKHYDSLGVFDDQPIIIEDDQIPPTPTQDHSNSDNHMGSMDHKSKTDEEEIEIN